MTPKLSREKRKKQKQRKERCPVCGNAAGKKVHAEPEVWICRCTAQWARIVDGQETHRSIKTHNCWRPATKAEIARAEGTP